MISSDYFIGRVIVLRNTYDSISNDRDAEFGAFIG